METTLVAVTLVSLGLAAAMSIITWRLVLVERRRESAQVAALVHLAQDGREQEDLVFEPEALTPSRGPETAGLFAEAGRESPAGRRLVAALGVAAIMAAGVGALLLARGRDTSQTTVTIETPAASATTVPLELVSLRHKREGDRLTITGLVLNPRNGRVVERTSAVAYVFDPAGTFIASGRAPVDFTTLGPGDESPFVVTVTAAGRIGRYRIGFRGPDDAVVGHVDRRVTP